MSSDFRFPPRALAQPLERANARDALFRGCFEKYTVGYGTKPSLAPTSVNSLSPCNPNLAFTANAEYVLKGVPAPNRGRIYFPKVDGKPSAGPIAILIHGNYSGNTCIYYRAFDDLMIAIAFCGIIVASIECQLNDSVSTRALRASNHLHQIKQIIAGKGVRLTGSEPLAVIGHSRGGEAAAILAAEVRMGGAEWPLVSAAVLLAPTIDAPDRYNTEQYATAQLVIQGAVDGDTSGIGVKHFDLFNKFLTTGPVLGGSRQALIWFHGGRHASFLNSSFISQCPDVAAVSKVEMKTKNDSNLMLVDPNQNFVSRVYVASFLRYTLLKDVTYRQWFNGDIVPKFVAPTPFLQSDIDKKLLVKVLGYAPSPTVSFCSSSNPNCMTAVGMSGATAIAMSAILNCPHSRVGYKLTWSLAKNSLPFVAFASPQISWTGLASAVIEFDVAQPLEAVAPLSVGFGVTGPVTNILHTFSVPIQQKLPNSSVQNLVMSTVRVPFSLFPKTTIASFKKVIFSFAKSAPIGTLYLSQLRVTPA